MEQRSPEWFAIRAGKVTASRVADVIAKTKSGWGASRKNYMAQLIAERLTGQVQASFSNAAMQWGTEVEPQARSAYQFITGNEVAEVGFVNHPTLQAGASPDGLVADDGLVEIKCPNTATHIDTFCNDSVDGDYFTQMQWQMACTGRKWCDFVSFDPRLPPDMQLKIIRVDRNQGLIDELENNVKQFLAELDGKISEINSKRGIQ